MDKQKKRLSQDEWEGLIDEIKGDCSKCENDCRQRLMITDFYVQQLKALHTQMLKTLQEMRYERKQFQGTTARLMSVYERLEMLNDKQREGQSSWKW